MGTHIRIYGRSKSFGPYVYMGYPYAYGQPIRVRVAHTHMGCQYAYGLPICIWDSPYAYGQNTCMGRNITVEGRPYLGAAIGTQEYIRKFMDDKVSEWSAEVLLLAKIGESQPHAAYSALTHGLSSRWRYVFRTVPNISVLLQPLEDVIRCTFLPVVLGISPPNDAIRSLLALPPRWGGLGVFNPVVQCILEYSASMDITEPLSNYIVSGQSIDYFLIKSTQFLGNLSSAFQGSPYTLILIPA